MLKLEFECMILTDGVAQQVPISHALKIIMTMDITDHGLRAQISDIRPRFLDRLIIYGKTNHVYNKNYLTDVYTSQFHDNSNINYMSLQYFQSLIVSLCYQ